MLGAGYIMDEHTDDYLRWSKIDPNYIGVGGRVPEKNGEGAMIEVPEEFAFLNKQWLGKLDESGKLSQPGYAGEILNAIKDKGKKFMAVYFDRSNLRDPWVDLSVIASGLRSILAPGGIIFLPYFSPWPASVEGESPEERMKRREVFDTTYQTDMRKAWKLFFDNDVKMEYRDMSEEERVSLGIISKDVKMWEIRRGG